MKHCSDNNLTFDQRVRETLQIDETSPSGLRWNSSASPKVRGKLAGTIGERGYWRIFMRIDGKPMTLRAHRIVWFLANGKWPGGEIDHINGRPNDNRLSNLREASREENNRNRAISKRNTSSIKGVSLEKKTGKWRARFMNKRKDIHIGLFNSLADAERAVMAAREKLHGEFSNHGKHREAKS